MLNRPERIFTLDNGDSTTMFSSSEAHIKEPTTMRSLPLLAYGHTSERPRDGGSNGLFHRVRFRHWLKPTLTFPSPPTSIGDLPTANTLAVDRPLPLNSAQSTGILSRRAISATPHSAAGTAVELVERRRSTG